VTGREDDACSLEARVLQALDEVRPGLKLDGGDVRLVAIEGDVVRVHLMGACQGCPMAGLTLVNFVEDRIKEYAPEVSRVVAD